MPRHAVPLLSFEHGREAFTKGVVLLDMPDNRFESWRGSLVREATADEVAAARAAAGVPDDSSLLTVVDYVDRYLAGEGRGDTEADLLMQQFAANHPAEIEQEFAARAAQGASPKPRRR